jgi:hypothetical protein
MNEKIVVLFDAIRELSLFNNRYCLKKFDIIIGAHAHNIIVQYLSPGYATRIYRIFRRRQVIRKRMPGSISQC